MARIANLKLRKRRHSDSQTNPIVLTGGGSGSSTGGSGSSSAGGTGSTGSGSSTGSTGSGSSAGGSGTGSSAGGSGTGSGGSTGGSGSTGSGSSTGGSGSSTGGSGGSGGSGSTGGGSSSGGGSSTGGSGSSGSNPAPVDPATGNLIVGLNANTAGWGNASTAPRLQQVTSQTGATWLREEFYWATIEPSPGVFDFSYYDHYMAIAAAQGVHILAVLDDTPSWAGADWSTIPANAAAYAQFVSAFLARYGANGSFWAQNPSLGAASAVDAIEIYNEPYFNSGSDYNPAAYAQVVKAAGAAAHAVDPGVQVLMGAEMQSSRDAQGDWQWWVDALYAAVPDLNNYFDAVAMHDYGDQLSNLQPVVPGQPYPNFGNVMRISDLRQEFVNHGAADKPFWLTETGWSTCSGDASCVSDSQQATDYSILFGDVNKTWRGFVQAVFAYSYQDGAEQPTGIQDGYGLVNLDGSAKPALSVFQQEEAFAGE